MTKKNRGTKRKNYIPAKGVKWAVEKNGILIVYPKKKKGLKLNQTESALWQLNMIKTPHNQLSRFLSTLRHIPQAEADKFIEELFELWREQRLLEYR